MSDPSEYSFAIRGGFTWLNPNTAGQIFNSGQIYQLDWTTAGGITNIDLEYSTNGGSSYSPILQNITGNPPATNISNAPPFNWKIPIDVVSKDVYVKITGTNDDPNSETPSQKIKIAGILYVDAPTSSVRWGVNTPQQIKWHTDGPIANIKIEYSLDGGANPIVWETPAITDSVPAAPGSRIFRCRDRA